MARPSGQPSKQRAGCKLQEASAHCSLASFPSISGHFSAEEGESVRGINATLDVAKNLRAIATVATDDDRNPTLLTVANGTIDLRTGGLRRAAQEDLITRATYVQCDP